MSAAAGAGNEPPTGDHGPAIQILQVFMILLAASSIVGRFVSRHLAGSALWWDDWTILAATFFSFAINVINLVGVQYGMGRHIEFVPDHGSKYIMTLFALELTYTTALAIAKIGVLLMYQRLFGINRRFSVAVNLTIGLVICWWLGVQLTTLLQCKPINKLWNYREPGKCINIIHFFEGSAIPNIVTDVIIILLPQPIIWKLRLTRSARIGLCAIFLLGAFSACTSIGRVVALLLFSGVKDFTYHAYAVIVWFSIEPPIGIACACLPCMGPLFRRIPGASFVSSLKGSISGPSGHRSNISRSTGGLHASTFGGRSERRPSDFDTESIKGLHPGGAESCKAPSSVCVSRRESMMTERDDGMRLSLDADGQCGHELDVIRKKDGTDLA